MRKYIVGMRLNIVNKDWLVKHLFPDTMDEFFLKWSQKKNDKYLVRENDEESQKKRIDILAETKILTNNCFL